jgi:Zn-dependent protease with chaperone function
VRLDSANRSFAGLVGASLLAGAFLFCAAAGCVLAALVAVQIARHGAAAFTVEGRAVWPAIAFVLVVGSGAVLGLRSLIAQAASSRRLAQRMRAFALPLPKALSEAAARAGLAGRVDLVDVAEPFSFAHGVLTPRVVVSRGLAEAASPQELAAVLEHERYHVRNLDPLKVLFARALPTIFFYLPALRTVRERYVIGRELAADRRAVMLCGRRPLAGALLKVVGGPQLGELDAGAAIGGGDLVNVRVAQLESGREPAVAPPVGALAASMLGGLALTALFAASVVSVGGPSAVSAATGTRLTALDVAGVGLCAVPWAIALWLAYRWLVHRARRALHTPLAQSRHARRAKRLHRS